jgi:hypothetical protein
VYIQTFIATISNDEKLINMISALLLIMSETSIPLDRATRDRLKSYGKKGETWIELINRILDERKEIEN